MVNTNKLKGRIVEMELNQDKLAELMNISQPTLSQKITNSRPMYLDEAEKLAELLEIPREEFTVYFLHKPCIVQD